MPQVDLGLLREALGRLLRAEYESASLIVALLVEGTDPAVVAAERGVRRPVLVAQLRDAVVGSLATRYERLANDDLNDWPAPNLQAALDGKRAPGRYSPQRHGTEDPYHKDQGHADPYHP